MITHFYSRAILACFILLCTVIACKKDNAFQHNAGAPITISRILPETGGKGTDVLISGSNFSEDKTTITVTLNGVACEVRGANATNILIKIPAKAGSGTIDVTINGRKVASETAFKYISSKKVITLAGSGDLGYQDSPDSLASKFYFYDQPGLTTDADGNIFVTDDGNHIIRKVSALGATTTSSGTKSSGGYVNGKGAEVRFNLPTDIDRDEAGNMYVADRWNSAIRKIAPDGTVSTLAAIGDPTGVGVDRKTGNVYAACPGYKNLYQIKPDGSLLQIPVTFDTPVDVAVDSHGNLLVVDYGASTIEKITAGTWQKTTLAGTAGKYDLVNGPLGSAAFNGATGIVIDGNDNVYIADRSNHCIRFIDMAAKEVSTLAGSSESGYKDGEDINARFNYPAQVALDKTGNLYVTDRGNRRIRKIIIE